MPLKFAFAGFRHGHILSLYDLVQKHQDIEVVAACEEHEPTRQDLTAKGHVTVTHDNLDTLFDDTEFDVLAVGEYFAQRGPTAIKALQRGKHVIVDKPLCTRLDEVDQLEQLSAQSGLKVGCMLTMRDAGQSLGMRQLVQQGMIGEVHAITFGGQHPLLLDSRPGWYFEPGKHGGTINDIAIHAIDALPWITGQGFARIEAARCWNAFAPEFPHFEDGGQMMLTLDNGAGVLGDVSYFMPDKAGYSLPQYWRLTLWGRLGLIETATTAKEIVLTLATDKEPQILPAPPANSGGYLESFLADIAGTSQPDQLDTAAVLKSARTVLKIQEAADTEAKDVLLESV
jgi:predicted dehydrogenase